MAEVYETPQMVVYNGKEMTRGDRAVAWISEHIFVPEGKLVGQRIQLMDFQVEFIKAIYDNPAGTRRAILSFGRKNGKTAAAAMLLLLNLVGPEAKQNAQLYSAARSRDQAATLFRLASQMVLFSPTLRPYVRIIDGQKCLRCDQLGTVYKALSKDATTALGLSPAFVVHDELGQVRGPRDGLYESLETASGAQDDPLTIVISTQAATDNDLLSLLIDDAKRKADPRVVLRIYEATAEMDPFSEEAARAANPAFGVFQNAEETMGTAGEASRMPSREAAFRNLVLNQRIEVQAPFISRAIWEGLAGDVGSWKGKKVFAGLDLSETTDLSAFVWMWQDDGSDVWNVDAKFWLPEEGLKEKSETDRVPYDIWRDAGYLSTVPGKVIDYDHIVRWLDGVMQECDFQRIAYDHWRWNQFYNAMIRNGMKQKMIDETFYRFGQSYNHMSPAVATLEGLILNQKIRHSNNPVMNFCMGNATVEENHLEQRRIVKKSRTSRIDGAIAMTMTSGILSEPLKKKKSTWDGNLLVLS